MVEQLSFFKDDCAKVESLATPSRIEDLPPCEWTSHLHPPSKPWVCYYGGKQRIAKRIVEQMPPHKVYVEPFAGGLSVLFAKGFPDVTNNHNYREVINDKFEDLVNLYRVMQDPKNRDRLLYMLDWTPHARAERTRAKNLIKESVCDVERAWAVLYGLNHTFANKWFGGWAYNKSANNLPLLSLSKQHLIKETCDRLRSAYIECSDFRYIFKIWDSPHTLFYCDPPYYGTHCGHYSGFTEDDFHALIDLSQSASGSVIISSYPNQVTQSLSDEWERVEINTRMSAGIDKDVSKARTELVLKLRC